ncbi:nuclear hormone receptor HR96 [Tribolium castaneum]|uniref:Hormone receptor in 96-like protein n=1 Tax=Tribolium castaneum TaxID=7070 RepID=D6X2K2_TRICA|nr:PREDICTED: nuclear hormone receptor HR96 isoform X2 [Tribolium castaneum]EFA10671.1 hormone receptor in 96-like protein [Tribolium castaneum]|eukprot:XP_968487.1 PREDICTED: nuclear hormone receptor HR96 isoform X2 [Tribolium castaneum]
MKSKVDTKVCGVCGDKALGYNFNAVTCESCKAFFRRNALVQKQFKCPFNDQCEITTITRRFCQKCRLDKCFAIGMCKDLIMSEEDKHLKRQKIEENRARKRSKIHGFKSGFKKVKKESVEADSQDSQSGYSFIDSDSSKDMGYQPNGTPNPVTVDLGNERLVTSSDDVSMIRNMLNNTPNSATGSKSVDDSALISLINNNDVNCNNNDPTSSSKSTLDVTKDVVEDVHRVSIEPNSIESILCEAIKLEFEAYSSIAQCHSNSRELNDAERAKLNELIVANKALLNPLDDELNTLIGNDYKFRGNPQQALETDPALVDVINLTAIVIRRLIKMAKKINAFKNMCQEDQVALLKGGCTEIMILRSAMNYDPTKQTWKIPHSQETFNLNVDILKLAKGNVYQEHERFINTFDPKWRSDENIVLILCAITLFTPDRPRVVHQDVIKLEQNAYYYLLRRYLESIYPGCEAKSTFLKLIQKIAELHRFNEELINVYLDVNPSQVEPLLIEIFDLKH